MIHSSERKSTPASAPDNLLPLRRLGVHGQDRGGVYASALLLKVTINRKKTLPGLTFAFR